MKNEVQKLTSGDYSDRCEIGHWQLHITWQRNFQTAKDYILCNNNDIGFFIENKILKKFKKNHTVGTVYTICNGKIVTTRDKIHTPNMSEHFLGLT